MRMKTKKVLNLLMNSGLNVISSLVSDAIAKYPIINISLDITTIIKNIGNRSTTPIKVNIEITKALSATASR